ncbi:hypothetical protein POSPLADRAFT_1154290 [Postia placenta MAD-698-R-SB12]|uniref:Uncharacterized protein n=1 Tax=Postia placenta MAD-698-R-SB12 TaxID=670580 RepID=A0A1X6MPJ3_9APHY|nr:hypothetical protein POSPLADRAFT_1154290 [Postia placenta MAD-698-R-SB12]OSX58295.1 hypothetical protein POSPLADRAFT_1154290 [Postia placenta MAD-698-R-SB12]
MNVIVSITRPKATARSSASTSVEISTVNSSKRTARANHKHIDAGASPSGKGKGKALSSEHLTSVDLDIDADEAEQEQAIAKHRQEISRHPQHVINEKAREMHERKRARIEVEARGPTRIELCMPELCETIAMSPTYAPDNKLTHAPLNKPPSTRLFDFKELQYREQFVVLCPCGRRTDTSLVARYHEDGIKDAILECRVHVVVCISRPDSNGLDVGQLFQLPGESLWVKGIAIYTKVDVGNLVEGDKPAEELGLHGIVLVKADNCVRWQG